MCTELEPQTMKELIKGVKDSWKSELYVAYCNAEINHINMTHSAGFSYRYSSTTTTTTNNVITKMISHLGKLRVFYFLFLIIIIFQV